MSELFLKIGDIKLNVDDWGSPTNLTNIIWPMN